MKKKDSTRRLSAIMFTDIVGYTALMQQDEAKAAQIRQRHRQIFDQYHQQYNGDILQYFGDGTLSVFQSGVEAVECALAIQLALQEGEPVPLRIGLHLGDIVFDGTEIYGDGVNVASRIESMGVGGDVLLSGQLNSELKNHLQITTRSLGRFELKNVSQPVEVFALTNSGIIVPKRSELKGKQKSATKSIAVLPFINMSSKEENEYFSDGMTEEIINALTKIKGLKVTSRTSSFFFKNKNIPLRQIGQELNVSTILEGSIRLAGNRMRITAQLIDVVDDYHFWSETFDRSVEDIFAVQDEISLLIADKLREHVGHFEIEDHLVDAPDISVDIYKRYLKSRYHLLKMTKVDLDLGRSILEDILRERPDFALAHLGMHLAYTLLGAIGLIPSKEAFAEGHPFLKKAMELNPDLPECHLHQAYDCFIQKWDLPCTYDYLSKSFEARPSVEYYQMMASTLVAEGKPAAAMTYIDTAIQLDPFSDINFHLKGFVFYSQQKFDKAIEHFKKSVELRSSYSLSAMEWGLALIMSGRASESLAFFQNLPNEDPDDILKLGGTTLAYSALGDTKKADKGLKELEAHMTGEITERALLFIIDSKILLERYEEALELIEFGVQQHLPLLVYLPGDPLLKPLRSDPRFKHLISKIHGEKTSSAVSTRKYKQTLLTKEELNKYKSQLDQLMKDQEPFLDSKLSLRSLAQLMEIPPNQLSQLLNEGFNQNFSEYVNSYRLNTFKKLLTDPNYKHMTLLALAYESGFNSKTVFNTFFKKMEGKTPKAYWKEVHE
jgi:adenylate cyclase